MLPNLANNYALEKDFITHEPSDRGARSDKKKKVLGIRSKAMDRELEV